MTLWLDRVGMREVVVRRCVSTWLDEVEMCEDMVGRIRVVVERGRMLINQREEDGIRIRKDMEVVRID